MRRAPVPVMLADTDATDMIMAAQKSAVGHRRGITQREGVDQGRNIALAKQDRCGNGQRSYWVELISCNVGFRIRDGVQHLPAGFEVRHACIRRTNRSSRPGKQRRDSSELTARDTAAADIPSLSAAPVKLRQSTMATKISISRNLSISLPTLNTSERPLLIVQMPLAAQLPLLQRAARTRSFWHAQPVAACCAWSRIAISKTSTSSSPSERSREFATPGS